MKIVLISPKGTLSKNKALVSFWNKSLEAFGFRRSLTGFSSSLLIIAALTPQSYSLKFIDENLEDIDFEEHYDLVAITCMTQQAIRAYEVADEFRKRGIKVVIGGIHPTVMPNEAKAHADVVVIGEAENIWERFLKDFKTENLEPFYKSEDPVDLTKAPIPRYDLVKKENYNVIWVQTTRGCPIDCEFCSSSKIFGLQLRHKTIDQVVKEIELIKKIWGSPHISFADDNLLIDRKYAIDLLKALKPLRIRFFVQTDISIAEDKVFLNLLRESGCVILFIGFESVNKESIKWTDRVSFKFKKADKYSEYIRKIQSHGIGIMGAFIVGFDEDDTSIFQKTADFIIDNRLYAAQITVLTPLPETRLRERLERQYRLLANSWDRYTFLDVNFVPKQMSPETLENGLLEIYKKVYSEESSVKRVEYFKNIYKNIYRFS